MLKMTLVTPEKKFAQDLEIERVIVPGYNGELTILEGHAPLVTTLTTGILQFKRPGQSDFEKVAISSGYCEVMHEGVQILAETAETADDIDRDRVQRALEKAKNKLADKGLSQVETEKYQRKLKRARARLSLLGLNDKLH